MKFINRIGFIALPFLTASLLLVGCSRNNGSPPGNSVVRGKVTYKGQALAAGTVEFWNEHGPVGRGMIQQDGMYEAVGLAEGNYQICVVTLPAESAKALERMGGQGAKPSGPPGGGPPGPPGGPPGIPGGPPVGGPPGGPGPGPIGPAGPGGAGDKPPLPPGVPQPGTIPLPPGAPADLPRPGQGVGPGGMPGARGPLDMLSAEKRKLHEEVQTKYGTVMVSKLTFTVGSGEQTHDLKLD